MMLRGLRRSAQQSRKAPARLGGWAAAAITSLGLSTAWGEVSAERGIEVHERGARVSRTADARDADLFPLAQPDAIQLVSCYACGNEADACGCGPNGPMGAGAAADRTGACQFTNPYWCNPYGEVYRDPCDTNTCSDCNSTTPPLWYATVEAVPMMRDQNDDVVFATLGAGGPAVLDTGRLKTEFEAGMRATMGLSLTDVFRLEGSFLGGYEWSDRAAVRNADDNGQGSTGNLFSPFSNFGVPAGFTGTDFNNFAQIDVASNFNSGELNLRRRLIIPRNAWPKEQVPCYATSFLMGLRYMKLDEHFGYLTNSFLPAGGSINSVNVDTGNSMFGAQVGLLSQFLVKGQGWIDFEVKGGIFHNQAKMQSAFVNSNGAGVPQTQFTGNDAHDRTAFLGELSLAYNRQLTNHFSCRFGYNAFWLTGVALASQNVNTDLNLLALGPAQLNHAGDLIMHGPSAGFTFAY